MLTADKLLPDRPRSGADARPKGERSSNPPHRAAPLEPEPSVLKDFTEVLTHRIRNLLAGIEGFTDLLTDTLGTPEQRELALRILEGTTRIEFVLDDLHRYRQPIEVTREPVPLADVIEHLLAILDDDELQHLSLSVHEAHREVPTDPLLLCQALLLLIQNALEAMDTLPHRKAPVRLTAAFDDDARAVRFDVWNAGSIAFEGADQRVFEPFFTTKARNLGIGLPLARRIAEAHGGTLRLSANDADAGTRFTLSLPLLAGALPRL